MTAPRNSARDKRVRQQEKQPDAGTGPATGGSHSTTHPGTTPHVRHEPVNEPTGHGPDLDEEVDKTESGEEP